MTYSFFIYLSLLFIQVDKEIHAGFVKNPVKIDAVLKEQAWSNADSIILHDVRKRTNSVAIVKTLWDKKNLYISFAVIDVDLKAKQNLTDHPELYLDDMVEFLVDTKNNKDSCWGLDDIIYHINIRGKKKDDRGSASCVTNPKWNGKAAFSVKMFGSMNDSTDRDEGYVVEAAIPWKELDKKPYRGLNLGINFAVGDDGKLFDWVGASPFRSPFKFGNIVLR